MITPFQTAKAIDMHTHSGMSWAAIADVIDVELEDLIKVVQVRLKRVIPREEWNKAREKSASPPAPEKPPINSIVIDGFTVIMDAPPPPAAGDGKMGLLAQKLQPGCLVKGLTNAQAGMLRKVLLSRGLGAKSRSVDPAKKTYDLWVLAEPTRRQLVMRDSRQKVLAQGRGRVVSGKIVGRKSA